MPTGVYSERFLVQNAPLAWKNYRIPSGHRAIVKSVTVSSDAAAGGPVHLYLAGYPLIIASAPVGIASLSYAIYGVAYAGDLLSIYIEPARTYAQVSGYLFVDPSGATAPPPGALVKPSDEPPPPDQDRPPQ